jgi:hypothetical protein
MVEITHDEIEVCTDCAQLVANDEATPEHRAAVARQWPTGHLVLSGGEEEDACFSSRPCDGCGSQLGGDRMPAVVFAS